MGKRNNANGVVGLPDRNTGSRADHLPDDGVSISGVIEYRLWVGSGQAAVEHAMAISRRNGHGVIFRPSRLAITEA
jgi:hypothetical protein